jgi:catechol 2,3-dioxygenase-like lactoylglutathione lyase family enzyme
MIQHVAIETPAEAVEAQVAFYALLGFERVEPPPSLADRAVWMERNGTQVHLLLTDDPVVPPKGHLAVVAGHYERTLAALRDAGHHPEPRAEHWGAPRLFVRDPVGHRVEVMSSSPAEPR